MLAHSENAAYTTANRPAKLLRFEGKRGRSFEHFHSLFANASDHIVEQLNAVRIVCQEERAQHERVRCKSREHFECKHLQVNLIGLKRLHDSRNHHFALDSLRVS